MDASRRGSLTGISACGLGLALIGAPAAAVEPPPETTGAGVRGRGVAARRGLHRRESGRVENARQEIIAQGTDWRTLEQLRRETKP